MSWGQAKLGRRHTRAALELFERGLALATEGRERYQEIRALEYIALAHLSVGDPPEAALEMARSATEWARKMPMLVGIIHGLAFQGLALSRLGEHAAAIAAADEAVQLLEGARPEGADAEIEAKAARLRDPELRKHFLASRQRAAP